VMEEMSQRLCEGDGILTRGCLEAYVARVNEVKSIAAIVARAMGLRERTVSERVVQI